MNSSQAKALVYYMFAGLGGDVKAQMALVRGKLRQSLVSFFVQIRVLTITSFPLH